MPNATALTLSKDAFTPAKAADVIFSVVDRREGTTLFRSNDDTSIELQKKFTVAVKQATANSKYSRVVLSLVMPEQDHIDVFAQSHVNRMSLEFQVDKRSTPAEIADAAQHMLLLLSNANVDQALTGLENFY